MTAQPRRSTHSNSNSTSTGTGSSSTLPEGYEADPTQGPMLRYQASLPHLPVPPLSSTLSKYLETLRPHLSPAEYARSESIVRAFGASEQAQELQRRLEARTSDESEGVNVNWLADWWNETAYMAFREPVVVNVSYFYVHVQDADADADEAICDALAPERAARLLKAMLPFRTLVET
jgi:carnitine O-acetyltransferase